MPEFRYVAMTRSGRRRRGVITATDKNGATLSLRDLGMYAMSLRAIRTDVWWKKEIYFGRKVSVQDFSTFCRQLATLIRAGVTILDSIRIMYAQSSSKPLKAALEEVVRGIEEGRQFSQCCADKPDIFPALFVSMVRAGELSGTLDDVLDRSAKFFERDYQTREKVKSALTYPIIVGIVSLMVAIFMFVKIVPVFIAMFASYNIPLPLPTQVVVDISSTLINYWWVLLALVIVLVGLNRYFAKSLKFRRWKDNIKMRIPIFGTLTKRSLIARMARTMSSLFASAVPVLQALQITSEVVGNKLISEVLQEAAVSLQSGRSLAAPIAERNLFPPLVVHMIMVGEQTGNLDFMLEKIADFYEAETEMGTDRLKSTLEPVMILVLAVIVGGIVLAVLLPSFSLLQNIH